MTIQKQQQQHDLEEEEEKKRTQIMEKQIGCMAGFFQIFDRHQILAGKRIYSAKRLPPAGDSESESEQSCSPAISKELVKSIPSPDRSAKKSPEAKSSKSVKSTKSPVSIQVFEFKEGAGKSSSPWKFSREAPRLSLDSRATAIRAGARSGGAVEEIENQRRSTSVIARLMGLEPPSPTDLTPETKSELRRSASESRVSTRDQFQFHFQPNLRDERVTSAKSPDTTAFHRPERPHPHSLVQTQRKSFFDAHQEIFPEPKQSVAIYSEIERRLKLRGIDEAPNDLDTLKQILEALQLKGLLHSSKPPNRRRLSGGADDSPIAIVSPARSTAQIIASRTVPRRNLNNLSPETQRNVRNRAATGERGVKSPNGKKPLSVETNRKRNQSDTDQKRLSPVHSPKLSPKRTVSDINKSPRYRKPVTESISETPLQTCTRLGGKGLSLLERCDQLLLSIAEITATELQPSPVSVLDAASFYGDDSSSFWSPSPVAKRSIDFKELEDELDDDLCSPEIPMPIPSGIIEGDSEDSDFIYIAEIFRVSGYLPSDSDVFQELEKRRFLKGNNNDTSRSSRVGRKLIFDTIREILDRNRQLPTPKSVSSPSLQQTWSEFQRIRERDSSEDLFEAIGGVVRKDLAGDRVSGWEGRPIEVSEAVLDIERLVFKDLVGETIGEMASSNAVPSLRRKLVF